MMRYCSLSTTKFDSLSRGALAAWSSLLEALKEVKVLVLLTLLLSVAVAMICYMDWHWVDASVVGGLGLWLMMVSAICCGWRVWSKRDEIVISDRPSLGICYFGIALPWVIVGVSPAMVGVGVIVSIALGIWGCFGKIGLRAVAPSLVLLAFAPAICQLDLTVLISSLREITALVAISLSQWFLSSEYVLSGFLIELSNGRLGGSQVGVVVSPECGGYRSFVGMGLLGLLLGMGPGISVVRRFMIVFISLFIAVVGNQLRVFGTIALFHYGFDGVASGQAHGLTSQIVLVIDAVIIIQLSFAKTPGWAGCLNSRLKIQKDM